MDQHSHWRSVTTSKGEDVRELGREAVLRRGREGREGWEDSKGLVESVGCDTPAQGVLTPPPETCQLTAMYFCGWGQHTTAPLEQGEPWARGVQPSGRAPSPQRPDTSTHAAGSDEISIPCAAADLGVLVVDLGAVAEDVAVLGLWRSARCGGLAGVGTHRAHESGHREPGKRRYRW